MESFLSVEKPNALLFSKNTKLGEVRISTAGQKESDTNGRESQEVIVEYVKRIKNKAVA